jgi:hypothetical protein
MSKYRQNTDCTKQTHLAQLIYFQQHIKYGAFIEYKLAKRATVDNNIRNKTDKNNYMLISDIQNTLPYWVAAYVQNFDIVFKMTKKTIPHSEILEWIQ